MTTVNVRTAQTSVEANDIKFNVYSNREPIHEVMFRGKANTTFKKVIIPYMSRQGYTAESCTVYKRLEEGKSLKPLQGNTLSEAGIVDGDDLYLEFK